MPAKNIGLGVAAGSSRVIGDDVLSSPEIGFDTLSRRILYRADPAEVPQTDADVAALLGKGAVHPRYAAMYSMTHRLVGREGEWMEIDTTYKGLATNKGTKRSYATYVESSSGERILMGASQQGQGYPSFVNKLRAMQPAVAVIDSYVTTGAPSLASVGSPAASGHGGALPAAPNSIWTFLEDPTWVYPSGWILERRDLDQLPGANVFFVQDHYVYHQMAEL